MGQIDGLVISLYLFVLAASGLPAQIPLTALQCPAYDASLYAAATSVHELRIHDIRVISALGDSITAGFAAKSTGIASMPFENRGMSFAMGGDDAAVSLPTLIRQYQPDLIGASIGTHEAEICDHAQCHTTIRHTESDVLNGAFSGAITATLLTELDYVESQMLKMPDVDFVRDFKYMNILIGANDLCNGCTTAFSHYLSPEEYEATLRTLLLEIRRRMPRVLVNVVLQFNVSQVWDLTHSVPACASKRAAGLVLECACAFMGGESGRRQMDDLAHEYRQRARQVVLELNDRSDPNFAVIVDPVFESVSLKDWPLEMLSAIDCFHPSAPAHALMARGIWNNLFKPLKEKLTNPDVRNLPPFFCPTPYDIIRTD